MYLSGGLMIVGGSFSAAAPVRPAASFAAASPTEVTGRDVSVAAPDRRPTHFTMISSISYSSLASAYQVMKAQQAGLAPLAHETPVAAASRDPAIISGLGVPAALDAYAEVSETGDS